MRVETHAPTDVQDQRVLVYAYTTSRENSPGAAEDPHEILPLLSPTETVVVPPHIRKVQK